MELDNIEAAKKMVEQGFGIALLPRTAVATELAAGTLHEVPIADAEPVRRDRRHSPPRSRGRRRGRRLVHRHRRGDARGAG